MPLYNHRLFSKTKEISYSELIEKFNKKELEYITIALLFGSRSNGTNHIKSDYDFAILTDDTDQPWGSISKAWNDIGDILDLPEYDYDIVDLKEANSAIIESVKDSYILLKGDKHELQRLFRQYH